MIHCTCGLAYAACHGMLACADAAAYPSMGARINITASRACSLVNVSAKRCTIRAKGMIGHFNIAAYGTGSFMCLGIIFLRGAKYVISRFFYPTTYACLDMLCRRGFICTAEKMRITHALNSAYWANGAINMRRVLGG